MNVITYTHERNRIAREAEAALANSRVTPAYIAGLRDRYRNLWLNHVDDWPETHRQAFLHMQQKAAERRESVQ
jgi:hypothetical protein